jgi:hypothetical protein
MKGGSDDEKRSKGFTANVPRPTPASFRKSRRETAFLILSFFLHNNFAGSLGISVVNPREPFCIRISLKAHNVNESMSKR